MARGWIGRAIEVALVCLAEYLPLLGPDGLGS